MIWNTLQGRKEAFFGTKCMGFLPLPVAKRLGNIRCYETYEVFETAQHLTVEYIRYACCWQVEFGHFLNCVGSGIIAQCEERKQLSRTQGRFPRQMK